MGNQHDLNDTRAAGLIYLIKMLEMIISPPRFLFLENVVGFEQSQSRNLLISAIKKRGYEYQEWIISPTQLGIPNERPRYYLTATLHLPSLETQPDHEIITSWVAPPLPPKQVQNYININDNDDTLKIPMKILKSRKRIDASMIAIESDCSTKCFTKGYGHYGIGTGSFLQTRGDKHSKMQLEISETDVESLVASLGLRLFSPSEILKLHGFPDTFQWPEGITTEQKWRMLGNSMSVDVVSAIMERAWQGHVLCK
jgi:tRNA (cytosine38-C5)-methyltransferase